MAVALPLIVRSPHPARRKALPPPNSSGSTSLPALPRVDLAAEPRKRHRPDAQDAGVPEPLREAPNEAKLPRGSPERTVRFQAAVDDASMSTAQLLILHAGEAGDLPGSAKSSPSRSPLRDSPPRRLRRSQSASLIALDEEESDLGRRPLWSHPLEDEDVEKRIREMDIEGIRVQQRLEFKKKFRYLPDAHAKRKIVGDPRLRNVSDNRVVERIRQEEYERLRQAARTIRGAMQDCCRSRQELKSMQLMLRGETEEEQRQKAADNVREVAASLFWAACGKDTNEEATGVAA